MNIDQINITSNLVVVSGPTASGKTKLAVMLAAKYDGEVINGDAFQVYRKMDIGTGKITKAEMNGIVHHLFDIVDYDQEFNIKQYQKLAREKIAEIHSRGKVAIICGGSTLYVQSVLYDYQFISDDNYQEQKAKNELLSLQQLQGLVKQELNNSDFHNHKRLVNIVTKEQLGLPKENKRNNPYYQKFDIIALDVERDILYRKINARVVEMFAMGLVDEVRQFSDHHYSQLAIGYKEVHMHLRGEIDLQTTIEMVQQNSRNYAKRQMSWYNNHLQVSWYHLKGETWIQNNY